MSILVSDVPTTTIPLSQEHVTPLYHGDGTEDVTITNRTGGSLDFITGGKASTATTTIANGANNT